MGGNALLHVLPSATFPRIPSALYTSLKATLTLRLSPLFDQIAVPRETPEKKDHGDIDFVVTGPRDGLQHEDIERALGAYASVRSLAGHVKGTSNFALHLQELEDANAMPEDAYLQVDVHVCADTQEWERVVFFHGYGDLGMIMGSLACSVGLHMGEKGLKMTSPALAPTHSSTFFLSSSFPEILSFFALSMDRWKAGFSTQQDAFKWIASSRCYDPRLIYKRTKRETSHVNRAMYQAFFRWNRERLPEESESLSGQDKAMLIENVRQEALTHFGKKDEHNALVRVNEKRVLLKATWNGKKVGEWTGWHGWDVGQVMKYVRVKVGEE
ncbi:hypothetical protein BV25DRAFT_1764386, partial [Artomyces pyxidatus]